VRGTLKGIEVECWGGEQAHWVVGILKLLQDLHASEKELSRPASALASFSFFSLGFPKQNQATTYWCGLFVTYSLG
jgi:hypothetical protein